jgi:type IV pilus assembly protein PilY1
MQFLASESGLPLFDPATNYYGVFDPTKCYQYATGALELFRTGGSFSKSASSDCPDPTHPWDGNVLNYVSMRRIDVAKWVLTGGKCDGVRNAIDGT